MAAGGGALIVVAMAGAGGAACVFAPVVCESLAALHRRTKIRSRVARGVNKKAAKGSVGIASYSSELVKWLSSTRISGLLHPVSNFSLVRRFAATLEFGGLSYTPVQAIVLGLLAFAITASLALLFTGNPGLAFIVGCCAPPVIAAYARREGQHRGELLRQQLPSALSSIAVSLGAGKSLQQALSYAAGRAPEPLASELQQTVFDIDAGRSLEEATALLEKRTAVRELAFVTCALSIQQRTGGSLKEILDSASRSVCDAFDLKRTLRVQTAQAKLSARIVTAMPFLLLGAFTLISPGYLMVFFHSLAGIVIFCVAILLDVCGLVAIRRLLSVEV